MQARAVTDSVAFHGEGAFWDSDTGVLRSVDMHEGDVLTLRADGTVERTHMGAVAAVIRARLGGGYVVATEQGFALTDESLEVQQRVQAFDDASFRMNEGGCDPQGRFYCGTLSYGETPGAGVLYRLDPDLTVNVVLEGLTIPNGLQWSSSGDVAYHVDSEDGCVWAYDFDAEGGLLSNRRPFITFSDSDGTPDGTAIDEHGGLWVAMWAGSAVRRFDADGQLLDVIDLPVSNVTSCAFGGEDGTTLYITTSQEGIEAGSEPLAGAIFAAETSTRGAAPHPFGG